MAGMGGAGVGGGGGGLSMLTPRPILSHFHRISVVAFSVAMPFRYSFRNLVKNKKIPERVDFNV